MRYFTHDSFTWSQVNSCHPPPRAFLSAGQTRCSGVRRVATTTGAALVLTGIIARVFFILDILSLCRQRWRWRRQQDQASVAGIPPDRRLHLARRRANRSTSNSTSNHTRHWQIPSTIPWPTRSRACVDRHRHWTRRPEARTDRCHRPHRRLRPRSQQQRTGSRKSPLSSSDISRLLIPVDIPGQKHTRSHSRNLFHIYPQRRLPTCRADICGCCRRFCSSKESPSDRWRAPRPELLIWLASCLRSQEHPEQELPWHRP